MELHNDEVPTDEVWAVTIEDSDGIRADWFITSAASVEDYRDTAEWWEKHIYATVEKDVTVARWYIELPRRGMPRDEVNAWVQFVATSQEGGGIYRRRLDVKRLVAHREGATAND